MVKLRIAHFTGPDSLKGMPCNNEQTRFAEKFATYNLRDDGAQIRRRREAARDWRGDATFWRQSCVIDVRSGEERVPILLHFRPG